ncbi:MAG: preprotein translocase subunit SecY [Planctomycetota bacterium]|jgi:preprotein translocase subunit SecY
MFKALENLFRIPELRKRIFVTFALLLVYRVGWNIPVPGIDPQKLADMMQAGSGDNPLLRFIDIISGGGIQRASLFSLGIMPYISASIIFSLLVKVIPSLEKLSKEGSAGQRKINQWTRYSTVLICIVQGVFAVRQFTGTVAIPVEEGQISTYLTFDGLPPGYGLTLGWVLALTTGTVFLMWIGEQITEHGVGNGISLLIMAGIVARLPQSLMASNLGAAQGFLLVGLFILVILGVVFITKGQRKIPVQYAKLTRGRRVYGGQRHYMPIRVNMAGVMPVIFASALLAFPPLLFDAVGLPRLSNALQYGQYLWALFYVGLTFFFAFFWVALMFNPVEMSKNMKEHGSFVPGIRPGRPTAEHLEKIMNRITLAGASFLALIAVLPVIVADTLNLPNVLTIYLGGTTILIVVSVALDLVDKLNSYLVMRNYEGFLRGGGGKEKK